MIERQYYIPSKSSSAQVDIWVNSSINRNGCITLDNVRSKFLSFYIFYDNLSCDHETNFYV